MSHLLVRIKRQQLELGQLPDPLAAVQALIDHAKKVSPSDRMTVYVGDLEHALGIASHPARTRIGQNDDDEAVR